MESVYGSETSMAALPGAAAVEDPAKTRTVKAAVLDLQAHVKARAAATPAIQDEARELQNILKSLAARFDEPGLGAAVVGHVTETEARLVDGLVRRLTSGRDHMELSYLRELADLLTLAVLSGVVTQA